MKRITKRVFTIILAIVICIAEPVAVYAQTPKHGYAYNKLSESEKELYDRFYDYSLDQKYYYDQGRMFLWGNTIGGIKIRDLISPEERQRIWDYSNNNFFSDSYNEEQQKIKCAFSADHGELIWFTDPLFDMLQYYPNEPEKNHYHMTLVMDTCREYIQVQSDTAKDMQLKRNLISDINNANRIANEVINGALQQNNDYDKLKYIHDWIIKNNRYYYEIENEIGTDYTAMHQTAASALLPDLSPVCAGYAEAFKVLCDGIGIPCVIVEGWAYTGVDWGYHSWCYVQLNEKWYAVDATYDDASIGESKELVSGYESDDYFLVGEDTEIKGALFKNTHSPQESSILPKLSNDKYNPTNVSNTPRPTATGNPIPMPKLTEWDGSSNEKLCELDFAKAINFKTSSINLSKGTTTSLEDYISLYYSSVSGDLVETNLKGDVKWTSSNTDVATFDVYGNIHCLSSGTASIIASIDGVSATCTITVTEATNPAGTNPTENNPTGKKPVETNPAETKPEEPAYESDIGLNIGNVEMFEGESATATLPANTKATVKCKSSKVAKVSYKKSTGVITITGKEPGTTTVTVKVGKTTEKINVNVKALPFTVSPESVNVNYKKKVDVSTVKKKNIKVSSSNNKVATAKYNKSKGKITIEGKAKGTATITVKYGDVTKYIAVNVDATTTKLKLPKKATISKVGKSASITINATPKKSITGEVPEISVDKPEVVSFEYNARTNKIKVTGLQSGSANITVKVGSKTGTVPVTVK